MVCSPWQKGQSEDRIQDRQIGFQYVHIVHVYMCMFLRRERMRVRRRFVFSVLLIGLVDIVCLRQWSSWANGSFRRAGACRGASLATFKSERTYNAGFCCWWSGPLRVAETFWGLECHGKEVSAPLHMCACTSAYAFAAESAGVVERHACAGMYVEQMLWTSVYTFASRSLQDVHMRACMCSLFHVVLGNEDGGVQLVHKSTCCLAWGVIFDRRKDRSVVCVFSIFNAGGSVCGCMVYTREHTLHWWGTWCKPRGRDETPRGPEESRWTKFRHTYIRIWVQSTQVYAYTERRDEVLD